MHSSTKIYYVSPLVHYCEDVLRTERDAVAIVSGLIVLLFNSNGARQTKTTMRTPEVSMLQPTMML